MMDSGTFELQPQSERIGQSTEQCGLSVGFLKGNSLTFKKNIVILPYVISALTEQHVTVFAERGLGIGADFIDLDYAEAGAEMETSSAEVCAKAEVIVSLEPPFDLLPYLRDHQILITPLADIDIQAELFYTFQGKGITAISLNGLKSEKGISILSQIMAHKNTPMSACGELSELLLSLLQPVVFSPSIRHSVQIYPTLLSAIYCFKGLCTNKTMSDKLQMPWHDLLLLCWNWN